MKKIMNDVKDFVKELSEGIVKAYPRQIQMLDGDYRILIRADKVRKNKVGVVTAGGSGHLPVFTGYVGFGMLDGCALGNVFASPSANKMASMIQAVDQGSGVLCLYGNYGGDIMNFEMACELLETENIEISQVIVTDDVASAPYDQRQRRRGVAGMVFAWKLAGAAAERGYNLREVTRIAQKASERTVSIGIALSPCIVPEVGSPSFSIEDDQMELGMGIHGEPGIETISMKTADEIAELMSNALLDDLEYLGPIKDEELAIIVNGLGGTPLEELYILYNSIDQILNEKEIAHSFTPYIGEYATSMEMAGVSLSFMRMDKEMQELFADIASTPFFTNQNK